jgi:hypothetical protein
MPPVEDHPVHELVRQKQHARHGCWNRKPFSDGYMAPSRQYAPSGNFTMVKVFIPHKMSTECRYDMSLSDGKCAGCQHKGSGEQYAAKIRAAANERNLK